MEDVLDVYHAPYDPQFPLVCMDESNNQLVGEVHAPLPPAPGPGQIIDHEYVRDGVAEIFLEVEPLAGRRHVAVNPRLLASFRAPGAPRGCAPVNSAVKLTIGNPPRAC
jgi:hypothetical protein